MLYIIITCLEPLLNCQWPSSYGVVVILERNIVLIGLGLTVTEPHIKIRTERRKKFRDGMPKSMQTR